MKVIERGRQLLEAARTPAVDPCGCPPCPAGKCIRDLAPEVVDRALTVLIPAVAAGVPSAVQLLDLFADDGVKWPVLNWPTRILEPLDGIVVVS